MASRIARPPWPNSATCPRIDGSSSGSKASPHVLLLVRAVRREFTLCEHRASNPSMVSPIFSPNSQHVFFMSDQHGKPAIYRIAVDKLVEATEDDPVVNDRKDDRK